VTHDAEQGDPAPPARDQYATTAGAYDLFAGPYRAGQLAALDEVRARFRPEVGPLLDVGAGSGAICEWLLTQVADAEVLALEPSHAMRSLLLARVAAHPEWFERITVWPDDFFSTPLPPRIGGAILLGVIGHFDAGERAAVLAELAARLPEGGAALIDLQDPETPRRVEPFEFLAATIGRLTYKGISEGWPVDDERMRWRMSYLTLDGERILVEDTVESVHHHPSPQTVADDAAQVGLAIERLGGTSFWRLTPKGREGGRRS
jgi:hypothetical protein